MQKIIPNLWFDHQAEEAAHFYVSLFNDSRIGAITHYSKEGYEIHQQPEGKVMTVEFELAGYQVVNLNGGPQFKFTPAISFFVTLETEAEVEALWKELVDGGTVMMPLDKYDWSEKYGWVQDRFGLSWQINVGDQEHVGQSIVPSLMFVNEKGKAEEAINHYTSIFSESKVIEDLRYGPGEEQPEGAVKYAQFSLAGDFFMAMDTAPQYADFTFNEAVSFMIICKSQDEVDYFWDKLTKGGEEGPCGWLKDKFGVSWQVVPELLPELLKGQEPEQVERVTKSFMQMKKLDIRKLEEAFTG